jgi:hypothetical protein
MASAETACSLAEKMMLMMTPYIATTSQKMMEIRFLVRMRGALTPPPRMEVPVMKMPLRLVLALMDRSRMGGCRTLLTDHAAPTTERPMHRPMPADAHA